MKKKLNKKLLNLIALCSGLTATVSLGIGGVIYSLWQSDPIYQDFLPDEVYNISANILYGFTSDIDWTKYEGKYDTILIPDEVNSISADAFRDNIVPSFINKIVFSKNSKCNTINGSAFKSCSSITSITFSGSLCTILGSAFEGCSNLSSITWNLWNSASSSVASTSFNNISQSGTVKVTNPVDSFDSEALLNYLKKSGGLPIGWTVAN